MIKQLTPFDCGIATLANALSVSYERALELYGHDKQRDGVTIQHTASILFGLGYAPVYTAFPGFVRASGIEMSTVNPEILERLAHPAILQVLTPSGVLHQVFFDGKNIHDPSPSVEGLRSVSEYECVDAVFVIKPNQALVRKRGFSSPDCAVCVVNPNGSIKPAMVAL